MYTGQKRSGKDRTGQMDVECEFLSTLIARGETIPESERDKWLEQVRPLAKELHEDMDDE